MVTNQQGFTIIEVIMFLAISGLLLAVAMVSVGTNINNSRFNDAIKSTTSYLQGQYNEVASGQSDRDVSKGCDASGNITSTPTAMGMSNCVIMGRFIKLQGSTLTVRYITGHRGSLVGIRPGDSESILDMSPAVAGESTYRGDYDVPWETALVGTKLALGSAASTGLAIIKSPASGNVLYYTKPDETLAEPILNSSFINDNNLGKHAELCFEEAGGGRIGRIIIADGQGQEVIQTDLANKASCS